MDDIVSYIYDEIGVAERTRFETHLANCSICPDEFAAISNARFSVFEWRREEFSDLATPEIVIPYPAKSARVEEIAPYGLWASVRAWISLVNFPVAAAAGLVVLLGLGFVASRFLGSVEQPIASNVKKVLPTETVKTPDVEPASKPVQPEVALDNVTPTVVHPSREIRPVNVVEHRRSTSKKQLTARNLTAQNAAQNIPAAPILSENYEESEDASLRLSDLFADVDS